MRGGILRIQLERVPQHTLRVRKFLLLQINFAEQNIWATVIRIQPHRSLERRLRFIPAFLTSIGVAQAVMSHGKARVDLDLLLQLRNSAIDVSLENGDLTQQEMRACNSRIDL